MILGYGSRGSAVGDAQRLVNAYFVRQKDGITQFEIQRAIDTVPTDGNRRTRAADKAKRLVSNNWVIATDDDFGDFTDIAVRIVQSNEDGLAIDGRIGPMTQSRLGLHTLPPIQPPDPTKNGFSINGVIYPVPGHTVVGSHDAAWAFLAPGDFRKRPRKADGSLLYFIRQYIVHKTIADDPEILLPGKGPVGYGRRTAEYWQGDSRYGGAHIIYADDGEIDQLADLYDVEAYHATRSNPYSVGSEMREVGARAGEKGGRFYEAVLRANTAGILVAAPKLGIQLQSHSGPYQNKPLLRMDDDGPTPGGPDVCGVFDHKQNTDQRGMWDAGAMWLAELRKACPGFELFDFTKGEDITAWKDRQSALVRGGHKLAITGVPGPETCAALKLEGYVDGIWALGKEQNEGHFDAHSGR